MTVKQVLMKVDFHATDGYGNPFVKFKAGEMYPENDETLRRVRMGDAELVDAPEPKPEPAVKEAAAEPKAQEQEAAAATGEAQPETPAAPAKGKQKSA